MTELDDAFPSDLDEIIDLGLRPYRPVLSHTVAAALQGDMLAVIESAGNLRPWVDVLDTRGRAPEGARDEGGLTPAQRALLGGSAPGRFLDDLVWGLRVELDSLSRAGVKGAHAVLITSVEALDAYAEGYPPAPAADPAAARGVAGFLERGVPLMFATMIGSITGGDALTWASVRGHEVELYRYFVYLVEAFHRAGLDDEDRQTFSDHYEAGLDPALLAARRAATPPADLARHDAFLLRFGVAMQRGIAALSEEAGPDPARTDPHTSPKLRAFVEREAPRPRVAKSPSS